MTRNSLKTSTLSIRIAKMCWNGLRCRKAKSLSFLRGRKEKRRHCCRRLFVCDPAIWCLQYLSRVGCVYRADVGHGFEFYRSQLGGNREAAAVPVAPTALVSTKHEHEGIHIGNCFDDMADFDAFIRAECLGDNAALMKVIFEEYDIVGRPVFVADNENTFRLRGNGFGNGSGSRLCASHVLKSPCFLRTNQVTKCAAKNAQQ